ncbi:MAG: restriction endonuclease subunit S [Opitutales bacterium]|nr:restriction endonuclease subunit S [Opitutales bacterium]
METRLSDPKALKKKVFGLVLKIVFRKRRKSVKDKRTRKMELKKYRLGDLCEVKRGTSLSGKFYATSGEFIRLTCGNFDYTNNKFKENTSKDNIFFTGSVKQEFVMTKGDLITPLTEQAVGLLGSTAIIPLSGKYIQSQDIAKIICHESNLQSKFAYYLISSKCVKTQLSRAAQQTKIRHTSPEKIKDCTVYIPPLEEQKKIAGTLALIDRKIELCEAQNRTLEKLARQIYDYWFVQFDFPDENGKPYKSSGGKMVYNEKLKREIPEGWEVKSVFDILSVQYGFPFSTSLFTDEKTSIPIVRIRDILGNTISTYSTEQADAKYLLHKGDLVVGMDGNFHMNYWCDDAAFLNQRCVRFRSHENSPVSIVQARYEIEPFIKAKERQIAGSTVGHLSDDDIKGLRLLVPATNFSKMIFDKILSNLISNKNHLKTLSSLRERLLPLLMNGQVEVRD